jgi:hypothetical protein
MCGKLLQAISRKWVPETDKYAFDDFLEIGCRIG